MSKDWTPEQLQNVMRYGTCQMCGAPREVRATGATMLEGEALPVSRAAEKVPPLREVPVMALVCPNGHPQ